MVEREWSPIKRKTSVSPTKRRVSCFSGQTEPPPSLSPTKRRASCFFEDAEPPLPRHDGRWSSMPSQARQRKVLPFDLEKPYGAETSSPSKVLRKAVSALGDPEAEPKLTRVFKLQPCPVKDWSNFYEDATKLVVHEKDFHRCEGDMRKLRQCEVKASPSSLPEILPPCDDESPVSPPISPRALFEKRCREPVHVSDPWTSLENPEKTRRDPVDGNPLNQVWLEPLEEGAPCDSEPSDGQQAPLTHVAPEDVPQPSAPSVKRLGLRSPITSRPVTPATLGNTSGAASTPRSPVTIKLMTLPKSGQLQPATPSTPRRRTPATPIAQRRQAAPPLTTPRRPRPPSTPLSGRGGQQRRHAET